MNNPRPTLVTPFFGNLLREWRRRAALSQLDLALMLDISTRHLSYLETGKSQPSETLLYSILRSLAIPDDERNTLLIAAGFRPRQMPKDKMSRGGGSAVLGRYLEQVGSNPVIVKDAIWDIVHANRIAMAVFSDLIGHDFNHVYRPYNALELVFAPDLLRPKLKNWTDVANSLVRHIRHEVGFAADHLAFQGVLEQVAGYPGFQERWDSVRVGDAVPHSTTYQICHGGQELTFESVLTSMGSPYDAVLRGIRLDTFLPADEMTQKYVAAVSGR